MTNAFYTNFPGQSGIPIQTIYAYCPDETYDDIIAPGFLNSAASAGIIPSINFIYLIKYSTGLQYFVPVESDGIYTLQVYQANTNSLVTENTFYVAQTGSDSNPGDQMGYPKLTIQAALNAANSSVGVVASVKVLDSEMYSEDLSLSPNKAIILDMGSAILNNATDTYAITLNDTGSKYFFIIRGTSFNTSSSNYKLISVSGAASTCVMNATFCIGDIYVEGGLGLYSNLLAASNINLQPTCVVVTNVSNGIDVNLLQNGGGIYGTIGNILGATDGLTNVYGEQVFNNAITYQYDVPMETAGRQVTPADSVSYILYNNLTVTQYILPSTTYAAIPIGTVINFAQMGTGQVQLTGTSDVTIISTVGPSPETTQTNAVMSAVKISDTVWLVYGNIIASP